MSVTAYVTEVAPTGAARCRGCENKIGKGLVRVGKLIDGGMYGLQTKWHHVECIVLSAVSEVASITGYAELKPEHKKLLLDRVEQSRHEVDADAVPVDPDSLVRQQWSEAREPPAELLLPLLPYQKEGLGWMLHQELDTHVMGGILADEMGMGKTIQTIALLLANKPSLEDSALLSRWAEADTKNEVDAHKPRGGTLIVLPVVAMGQWQAEIARFTAAGALTVRVFHGSARADLSLADLCAADVVLTSYKTLEAAYRRQVAGAKVVCRVCGKKFYAEKLRVHRTYFCGELAQKTEAQARQQKKKLPRLSGAQTDVHARQDSSDDHEDSDDSDGSDHGDEDEVDKQKRLLKRLRERKQAAEEAKQAAVASGKSKGKGKGGRRGREESEDEVDRQKRLLKEIKVAQEAKKTNKKKKSVAAVTVPPPSKRKNNKVSTPSLSRRSSVRGVHSDSEEDEDDDVFVSTTPAAVATITAASTGKRSSSTAAAAEEVVKRTPARRAALKITSLKELSSSSSSGSDDDDDREDSNSEGEGRKKQGEGRNKQGEGSKKKVGTAAAKGSKVRRPVASNKHSDSSVSVSSASSDDDEDDEDSEEDEKEATTAAATAAVTSSVSKKRKWRSVSSRGAADDQQQMLVEREVERDIAAARRSAPRAVLSELHRVSWFRTVLDEAHMVKDRSTSTARAVFNLDALYKWCLTGTPLQNRVGELYSLIRFLRVDPHAFYFCKSKACTCKSLHYRFTKGKCDDCGHTAMTHSCHFNRTVLNPIQRCGYVDEGKRAMVTLKRDILDVCMLRRTKSGRADDIQLPPRLVRVRAEELSEQEEDFYAALYTQSQAQFNAYVQSGTVLNNYAHIFDILIRLRQAVDHPYLVTHSASSKMSPEATYAQLQATVCGLCGEEPEDAVTAACNHQFCRACILEYLTDAEQAEADEGGDAGNQQQHRCPDCNEKLTVDLGAACRSSSKSKQQQQQQRKGILSKVDLSRFQSSSKIEALVQELTAMRVRDPGAKAIVFSQFVSMLDLIQHRLHLHSCQGSGAGSGADDDSDSSVLKCVRLQGSMSVEARERALASFKGDERVCVLLISLKAGGVALNLTCANHIFLMDPWWNPAAEMQAIDRTHRLGQNKPIYATRFVAANTIEDRILRLQDKKKLVFDSTVGGDASAMARLSVDDMRFLFQ